MLPDSPCPCPPRFLNQLLWRAVFFSPWTSKVPVNLEFWHLFTGTFLGSRAFFQKIHGQVVAFTGTFLDVFTGTFSGFTGKKNEIFTDTLWCSRAYFDIQSFMFTGTCQCSRTLLQKNEIRLDRRKIKVLMFSYSEKRSNSPPLREFLSLKLGGYW